jgi:hypothetical protein
MVSPIRRASERKERQFQGEAIGTQLVRWLRRQSKNSAPYKRITSIVALIVDVTSCASQLEERDAERFEIKHHRAPTTEEISRHRLLVRHMAAWWEVKERYEETREQLNGKLALYNGGAPYLTTVATRHGVFDFRLRKDREEWTALNLAMRLSSKDGLLHRVRQCETCGRWFFGRFDSQSCCSDKCRIRKYRSTEKWKQRHREQQRDRYRLKRDHPLVR